MLKLESVVPILQEMIVKAEIARKDEFNLVHNKAKELAGKLKKH